jgi:hypothetical protein
MKNFGKALYSYAPVIKTPASSVGVGYDIFSNLNKFDDPNRSKRDKVMDATKAVIAPIGLIPGVGRIIATAADGVVDAAGYIQDVLDGKKDAPPIGEDINTRTNPIGTIPGKIINSTPFKNFFSRW